MNAKIVALVLAVVACICLCQAAEYAHPHAFCLEPIDGGMCRGDFEMFAYNSEINACVQFTYGGCMGNDNLFSTMEECEKTCVLKY